MFELILEKLLLQFYRGSGIRCFVTSNGQLASVISVCTDKVWL